MTASRLEGETGSTMTTQDYYRLLLPQAFVGLVDSISMMVVAPSVVFYVYSLGGTKEQYGLILSVFSFASFLLKPILGYWCDKSGYKFTKPYLVSIAAASLGGLLYFLASNFAGKTAVAILLLARFLGGMGAANSTLGFTYVAAVVPHDQMTKFTSLLSMVRVLGMTMAPGMNIFLANMHVSLFGLSWLQVTPLNSVGLFLLFSNVVSFVVIYLLLEEPPEENKPGASPVGADAKNNGRWDSFKAFFSSLAIVLTVLNVFVLNANFQLMETGLAPAASSLMGWDPVKISSMFAANAVLIFILIILTFQLASMGVKDDAMLMTGLVLSVGGYTMLYYCWHAGVSVYVFLTPFFLSTCAFPFLGAPTRSIFTRAIHADPLLSSQQGTMQAIMSMSASVAGFTAPGLIAAFVLRTPEQVTASHNGRAFTAWALFAPIFSLVVLVGFIYLHYFAPPPAAVPPGMIVPAALEQVGEGTSLLAGGLLPQDFEIPSLFHPRVEAYRRHSITLMGIPQISFHSRAGEPSRHTIAF